MYRFLTLILEKQNPPLKQCLNFNSFCLWGEVSKNIMQIVHPKTMTYIKKHNTFKHTHTQIIYTFTLKLHIIYDEKIDQ